MSVGELLPFWAMLACSALIYGAILWELFPGRGARRAGREATDQEPAPPPPTVTGAPITFTDRATGVSKMSPAIAREAIALALVWRWHEIRGRFVGATARTWQGSSDAAD